MEQLNSGMVERLYNHLWATRFLSVAGFAIFAFDTCITLGDEIRYIWRSTSNIAKLAHLTNKYLGLLFLALINLELSGLTGIDFSDKFCRGWIGSTVAFGFVSLFVSNILVLLRVTVVWDNRRRIIGFMLLILAVTNIGGIVSLSIGLAKLLHFANYSPVAQVCVIDPEAKTRYIGFVWGLPLVFDLSAVVLTFLNSLHRPRPDGASIWPGLREDGFFFFSALAVFRLFNLLAVTLSPPSLVFLGGYFCWAAVITALSRFLIHLRKKQTPRRRSPYDHGNDEYQNDNDDDDDEGAEDVQYNLDNFTEQRRARTPFSNRTSTGTVSDASFRKYS